VTIAELLDVLWRDYVAFTPQAGHIQQLLTQRGEMLCNDHIAFRTYGCPGIDIDAVARPFEALGWRPRDHYRIPDTHVRARYWQHHDEALPKVLIGELVVEELSPEAQAVIGALVAQLPTGFGECSELPWAGRPWHVALDQYRALLAESEHGAWVAAFGFRVHRFTVDIGSLSTFPDLEALGAFLAEHGEQLDERGGAIKGSRAERFEQSSTRPELVAVEFCDATVRIPSGCYQFARRYRLPSGELFHGFVPATADRSFEADQAISM
jgi:hypothetical protein